MKTSTTIARWSKAALVRHRAEQQRGILQPSEAIKTLAQYHIRGASFLPVELKLEAGLPEGDWMDVARAVACVRECAHFWLGDLMAYGVRLYGVQTAYDLARQATGLPEGTLRDALWCSRKYTPEQRKAALSYCHHLVIAKYPPDGREKILTEAIELGLTTRECRKMAEEMYGKTEKPKGARVNLTIHLWPETVEKLKEMADGRQLTYFCSRVIEDWLREHGHGDCIRRELTTKERRDEWRKAGICYLCGSNPATEGKHTCEDCRSVQRICENSASKRPGSARWRRAHAATVATIEA